MVYTSPSDDSKLVFRKEIEVVPLKSQTSLSFRLGDKAAPDPVSTNELSDHYPVVANFLFKPKTSKNLA